MHHRSHDHNLYIHTIRIYIYIYIYIYTYIRTYVHTYIHTCIHTYIHTYMHACMHTYIYTHTLSYIYIYIYTCMYIHTLYPAEHEPVRRSFRRRRSCTFTEVARLVPSGGKNSRHLVNTRLLLCIYIYIYMYTHMFCVTSSYTIACYVIV